LIEIEVVVGMKPVNAVSRRPPERDQRFAIGNLRGTKQVDVVVAAAAVRNQRGRRCDTILSGGEHNGKQPTRVEVHALIRGREPDGDITAAQPVEPGLERVGIRVARKRNASGLLDELRVFVDRGTEKPSNLEPVGGDNFRNVKPRMRAEGPTAMTVHHPAGWHRIVRARENELPGQVGR
jgi:hypothetical protein